MKIQTVVPVLLGSVMAFTSGIALADKLPENSGKMTQVLEDLKDKGYSVVKKIEFDKSKGGFNAKVVNAVGKNIDIHINATGQMSKSEDAVEGISALEVSKKVTDAGYPSIYEINTEMFGDKYEVQVLDKNGKKMEIKVDAKTGNIIK